jgi:hypothetical protein
LRHFRSATRGRRGSSLVVVAVLLATIAGFSLAAVVVTNAANREQVATKNRIAAMYVAEAGMSQALFDLTSGGTGAMGTAAAPIEWERSRIWVETTDLGGGRTSLRSSGVDRGAGYRVEVVVQESSSNLFEWAAFGDAGMTLASNAMVDSYNSSLGPYEDQETNGSGQDTYALENGNVGSNQNVALESNAGVHGLATPGPAGAATTVGNSFITGATTPALAPFPLPALNIPVIAPSGSLVVTSSTVLPAGNYNYTELTVDGNEQLLIEGPATIVVTDMTVDSNSKIIVDATNGEVEFFVLDDFVMNSNTLIASTTYNPADVRINLESDNVIDPSVNVDLDEVDFDSNAKLYGTIYAPNAAIEINSNFELFGSLVAYHVHLDSNSKVHFDEALLNGNATTTSSYVTVMWHGVPFTPHGSY